MAADRRRGRGSLRTPAADTILFMSEQTIRCGVVGVGRMGRHHARLYTQVPGAELVGVVDQNPQRRSAVTEEYGGRPCATVEELLALGVDAVTIAVPTVAHRAAAEPLLEAGVACLIEKPLASDDMSKEGV